MAIVLFTWLRIVFLSFLRFVIQICMFGVARRVKTDLRLRESIQRTELQVRIYRSLFRDTQLTPVILQRVYTRFYEMPRFLTKIRFYCFLTGKSRAILTKYTYGRFALKTLFATGAFTGVQSASW